MRSGFPRRMTSAGRNSRARGKVAVQTADKCVRKEVYERISKQAPRPRTLAMDLNPGTRNGHGPPPTRTPIQDGDTTVPPCEITKPNMERKGKKKTRDEFGEQFVTCGG